MAGREVIAVFTASGYYPNTAPTSVTIGGVAATVDAFASSIAANCGAVVIARATVEAGETCSATITFEATDGNRNACAVGIWTASGAVTVADTLTAISVTTVADVTGVVTGAADGLVIAGTSSFASGAPTVTWSGLTERYDAPATTDNGAHSGSDSTTVGDITITAAVSVTGLKALAAVAYAPAV